MAGSFPTYGYGNDPLLVTFGFGSSETVIPPSGTTVIGSTIGTLGGEDYPTIADWVAATTYDHTIAQHINVGYCSAQTFTESVLISGAITNSGNYRYLTTNAGYHYGVSADSNFKIVPDNSGIVVQVQEEYSGIEKAEISGAYGRYSRGISLISDGTFARYNLIHNLASDGWPLKIGITMGGYLIESVAYNNIIRNLTTDNGQSVWGIRAEHGDSLMKIYNNTLYQTGISGNIHSYGIDGRTGKDVDVVKIKNNICIECGTDFTFDPLQDHTNNISSDNTASGVNSISGATFADLAFTSPTDLHIGSNSIAAGAGANFHGAIFASGVPTYDIDLVLRDETEAWSIGVDEYISFAPSDYSSVGKKLVTLTRESSGPIIFKQKIVDSTYLGKYYTMLLAIYNKEVINDLTWNFTAEVQSDIDPALYTKVSRQYNITTDVNGKARLLMNFIGDSALSSFMDKTGRDGGRIYVWAEDTTGSYITPKLPLQYLISTKTIQI